MIMSSIEVGGERRSHTNFSDDVTVTLSDTAWQNWWPIQYTYLLAFISACLYSVVEVIGVTFFDSCSWS